MDIVSILKSKQYYSQVALACVVVSVAAEADPVYAYANGLTYGAAYTGLAGAIPAAAAYHGAVLPAAAPVAAYAAAPAYTLPAAYAHAAPLAPAAYAAAAPVIAAAPAASAYALPPVQTYNEAPIVEQIVEPVEQWGYKVAY